MIIKFSPQRSDSVLQVDAVDQGLVINGTLYDFTNLERDAIPTGPIVYANSAEVCLVLPIGPNPTSESAFPTDVEVQLGAVPVPGQPRPSQMQEITRTVVLENQPIIPAAVPTNVTMRQARLALLNAGKLALIDPAIEALPEPQKTAAKIEWEYSQEVHRDKSFVQVLAQAVGLNDTQLDELFVQAASL